MEHEGTYHVVLYGVDLNFVFKASKKYFQCYSHSATLSMFCMVIVGM